MDIVIADMVSIGLLGTCQTGSSSVSSISCSAGRRLQSFNA